MRHGRYGRPSAGASLASTQSYWAINPTQSYAQLSIQSTVIPASLSPLGVQLTIDSVNQAGSPHAWDDGNVGPLAGYLATTGVFDGSTVQFAYDNSTIKGVDHTTGNPGTPPGTHTLGFTPNPALWNPTADDGTGHPNGNYTGTFPPAPAMWANNAYVEEITSMVTSNAFQDTHFGVSSGALPVSSGTFNTSTSDFGLTQTDFLLKSNQPGLTTSKNYQDMDPNANPHNHGPDGLPAPSTYNSNVAVTYLGAGGLGQIIPLGGDSYTMIMPFVIAPFVFYLGDVPFGGVLQGVIVATHVPEPSTFLMAGFGLVALSVVARRRFRKA